MILIYFLLKTEPKLDRYTVYLTPRSNQPVTPDVAKGLFSRFGTCSAVEVRARHAQLADAERKSRSLPVGMYFKEVCLETKFPVYVLSPHN